MLRDLGAATLAEEMAEQVAERAALGQVRHLDLRPLAAGDLLRGADVDHGRAVLLDQPGEIGQVDRRGGETAPQGEQQAGDDEQCTTARLM